MSESGLNPQVMDDCVKEFENMKNSKAYYGIVYKLTDDKKSIVVEEVFENPTGDETDTTIDEYQKFVDHLIQCGVRFACYDIRFTTGDGVRHRKLVFFSYADDNAHTKLKMCYSTTRSMLKSKLIGIDVSIQANDADEVAFDEVIRIVSKGRK